MSGQKTTARRVPKDLRAYARQLRRAGWTIHPANNGHVQWRDPDDVLAVTTSATFSDVYGIRHARRDIRKAAAERGIELR